MNDDTDCKYWIQLIINRTTREILKLFGVQIHPKFRYRGRMSKDPYIAWITACTLSGNEYIIKGVTLPWYLFSQPTWRWRRRLIEDNRDEYVQRLGYLRSLAVVFKFEKP